MIQWILLSMTVCEGIILIFRNHKTHSIQEIWSLYNCITYLTILILLKYTINSLNYVHPLVKDKISKGDYSLQLYRKVLEYWKNQQQTSLHPVSRQQMWQDSRVQDCCKEVVHRYPTPTKHHTKTRSQLHGSPVYHSMHNIQCIFNQDQNLQFLVICSTF